MATEGAQVWSDRILAIRIGMDTAAEIVRRTWGQRFAQCVVDYESQWAAKVEARRAGCREMVETDIYLPRPMMLAADIGWPQ